jgi:hypothetical protein
MGAYHYQQEFFVNVQVNSDYLYTPQCTISFR